MRTIALVAAILAAILAVGAAEEHVTKDGEVWMASTGEESSLLNQPIDVDTEDNDNTPSRQRREACGRRYKFSSRQRREAVQVHNRLRANEGASNMMALKWSHALARRAHQWASKCQWRHGLLTDCQGNKIGQNLYLVMGEGDYVRINVTNFIVNSWWAEKKYAANDRKGCSGHDVCGHYLQVVWAEFKEFGCSIVKCPFVAKGEHLKKDWKKAVMVACDYGPGRMTSYRKAYLKGPPCSQCDSVVTQGYYCKNKLCHDCTPAKRKNCKCTPKPCARGLFNKKLCKCMCPKGFWGENCSKTCACKDVYSICYKKKPECFDPWEFRWLRVYCPATCINTCDRPQHGCT